MSDRSQEEEDIFGQVVERRLQAWGVTQPPVPCHFAKAYAPVKVYLFDWKRLHGAVLQENGTLVIGLNRNDSPEERRYTLFHEISHFELEKERHLFGRLAWHPEGGEHMADLVARRILMPTRWAQEAWRAEPQEKKLSKVFKVPQSCARARLIDLGLLDKSVGHHDGNRILSHLELRLACEDELLTLVVKQGSRRRSVTIPLDQSVECASVLEQLKQFSAGETSAERSNPV